MIEMSQQGLTHLKRAVLGFAGPEETRSLYKTPFLELCERLNPATGTSWVMVRRPHVSEGATVVVALTSNNEVILIEQHRVALQVLDGELTRGCIELPAGLIGDSKAHKHEGAEATALRELTEEAGYMGTETTYLGSAATSPGMTDEIAHFVKVDHVRKISEDWGVDGEHIQNVHVIPLDHVMDWLAQKEKEGFVINCAVYAGLMLLRQS